MGGLLNEETSRLRLDLREIGADLMGLRVHKAKCFCSDFLRK